jgi:hypothetical protein
MQSTNRMEGTSHEYLATSCFCSKHAHSTRYKMVTHMSLPPSPIQLEPMAGSSEIGYRLPIHDATELAKHALFVVCGVCATCRMLPPEPAYTVQETQTEAHVCQLPHMHFTLREVNPRRPPSAKILNEKNFAIE